MKKLQVKFTGLYFVFIVNLPEAVVGNFLPIHDDLIIYLF